MDSSAFRGTAGEVVRGFVHLGTLLTIAPVLITTGVALLLLGAVAEGVSLPAPAVGVLVIALGSTLVGRFALPARAGDLRAGFVTAPLDSAALGSYVVRATVLTLLWAVPAGLVVTILLPRVGGSLAAGGPLAIVDSGGAGLGLALVALSSLLAPTAITLVATRTDSLTEALAPGTWRWLAFTRRDDLVPLYAALLGGGVLFTVLAWSVLLVIALLVAAVALEAAAAVVGFAWLVPAASAPVLLGRLAGAFVVADEDGGPPVTVLHAAALASDDLPGPTVSALATLGDRTPARPPDAPSARTDAASEVLRRLRARADDDLSGAIEEAERAVVAQPGNAALAAELAALHQRAGDTAAATHAAARAIQRALQAGTNGFALEVFRRFAAAHDDLDLDATSLDRLGWVLIRTRDLDAAEWCFTVLARDAAETTRVEKGRVGIADAAAAAGDTTRALRLYRGFLAEHAEAALAPYVRSALLRLEHAIRRPEAPPPVA